MSSPTRSLEPEAPRGSAVIGKSVMIKGQILSREDLTIDGEMEGTVECQEHRLTVGPNGRVQAGIKAREILVLGTVHGNVEVTDRIEIRKDAKLIGDIKTARIVIEDGAYFKGSTDIVRPEVGKQPVPAPKPAPAAASASSAGANPQAAASSAK
ncbi:MAG: bactofilin family protein [Bryobacteraceae bacterium]